MGGNDTGGWLTTKKRGRDDDRIAQDKAVALENRKQRISRNRKSPAAKKPAIKKEPGAKKKGNSGNRRCLYSTSTESSSSNSFIVGDDEGLEEFDDDDDDDDKVLLDKGDDNSDGDLDLGHIPKPPQRKRLLDSADKKKHNASDRDDLLSDGGENSSEEELLTFLPQAPKRVSKQAPHMALPKEILHQKQSSGKVAIRNPLAKFKAPAPSAEKKSRETSSSSASRLSSDNDVNGGVFGRTSPMSGKTKPFPKRASKKSNYFQDDEDDKEEVKAAHVPAPKKRRKIVDDESPFRPHPNKFQAHSRKASMKSSSLAGVLLDSDEEDEDMAMAMALSASMVEDKQENEKIGENEYIELEYETDDGDSDDEQGDTSQDYMGGDKDARTAAYVLKSANDLSAQVLRAMQSWSASSSTESNAVAGMIVDGALAVADISTSAEDNHRHDWISQETMKEICPNVTLGSYQLIGVNWMALLHGMTVDVEDEGKRKKKTSVNGVLADEMGLGKTAQTICFLAWLRHQRELVEGGEAVEKEQLAKMDSQVTDLMESEPEDDEDDLDAPVGKNLNKKGVANGYVAPHLVVCPSSVVSNWEREFEKFAPHLNVVKYHGSMSERADLKERLRLHLPKNAVSRKRAGLEPIDVILTPITYFQKEKSEDRTFLRKFQYNYMVVDEAHLLKNSRGLRYTSLDSFCTQHRLLLTGTPVQNSPQELMSLLCFLMPLFSRKTVAFDDDRKNDGGESMLQHFVSLENANDDAAAYRKLKLLFAPFVLRRRKQDVLSQIMPPKKRQVEFVTMDPASRKVYEGIIENHVKSRVKGNSRFDHVFTQLRKAAHHPLLLRTRYTSEEDRDRLAKLFMEFGYFRGPGCTLAKAYKEVDNMNDFDIHLVASELIEENPARHERLAPYILSEDALFTSAKFVRLRTLLPELIADGQRILIFSVWTSCLDLLTCLLDQMNIAYLRMQGSTPVNERQHLIDSFTNNTSIPVFLLSTKACGLGLNLTAASVCIMHDIGFNPFDDLQAEDRVHRIGQKKVTTVIKFVTAETVDADIYEMQERKARMNAAIMGAGSCDEDWTKNAKATQDMVFQTAVNRYLKSTNSQAEGVVGIDDSSTEDGGTINCDEGFENSKRPTAASKRASREKPKI